MDLPLPDYGVSPEPPPPGQTVVEVVPYPPEECRFIITVDAGGAHRVFEDGWVTSWVREGGPAFWRRSGPIHFTDTLARARSAIGRGLEFPSA